MMGFQYHAGFSAHEFSKMISIWISQDVSKHESREMRDFCIQKLGISSSDWGFHPEDGVVKAGMWPKMSGHCEYDDQA